MASTHSKPREHALQEINKFKKALKTNGFEAMFPIIYSVCADNPERYAGTTYSVREMCYLLISNESAHTWEDIVRVYKRRYETGGIWAPPTSRDCYHNITQACVNHIYDECLRNAHIEEL